MPKVTPQINNFNAGELSPKVEFRNDIEKYYSGATTLENVIPLVEGGVTRVPGTYYVTSTKSNGAARLVKFAFSTTQQYILEFGNLYIRFYKDEGQIVLAYSAWLTGQAYTVGLLRTNAGSYYRCLVAHTSGTFATDLAAGYWVVTTATDLAYEIPTTYATADLFKLNIFQSADTMIICHKGYPTKQLTRTGHTSWTLTNFVAKKEDAFTITAATKANPCVLTLTYTDTAWAISTGYTVGNIRTHENEHYYCAVAHTSVDDADLFLADVAKGYWRELTIPVTGDIMCVSGITGMTELNDRFFDVGTVTDNVDTLSVQLSGINSSAYSAYTSDGTAQKSVYGTTDNCPACGTYYEQRLLLGGTTNNPQTFTGSQSADFDNFTETDTDDGAITYRLNSTTVDAILSMLGHDSLVVFTDGGIYKVGSSSLDKPMTASNITVRKFFNIGAKDIQPELVTDSVMWTTRGGNTIRKIGYNLEEDKPIAVDMCRLAKHITYGATSALSGIKQMAFQREPLPILWCIRNDGQLIGLTYETQENVFAFFRVKTDGNFESIAVIGDQDEEEQLWTIVNRTISASTKRYVEYFKPIEFFSQIKDCFFVHSGLTWIGSAAVTITGITKANPAVVSAVNSYSGGELVKISGVTGMTQVNTGLTKAYTVANPTGATFELQGITSVGWDTYVSGGEAIEVKKTFTGLEHLEGESVNVVIDGTVAPSETVASGSITADYYGNKVHVGLPYTSTVTTTKLNSGSQQGSVRGKKQRINKATVVFYETFGAKVGKDADHLETIPFGTGIPPTLFTGDKDVSIDSDWNSSASLTIVQDIPMPMTVLGVVPHVTVNEN
jgi:hypothetical protein